VAKQLIVCGFDDGYVWPWMVHLFSGEQSRERPVHRALAVTADSLNEANKELIRDVARWLNVPITWLDIELPRALPISHHLTDMTYARLTLADTLDETFVWMDVDTLLSAGWDALSSLPQPAPGFVTRAALNPLGSESLYNEAAIRAGDAYFNAGVMQVNPRTWQDEGFPQQWVGLSTEYSSRNFQYWDQCILNYLLVGANEVLDDQFNWRTTAPPDKGTTPHVNNGRKPWNLPAFERLSIVGKLATSPHGWHPMYWDYERKLISAATDHSKTLGRRLNDFRLASRDRSQSLTQRAMRKLGQRMPGKSSESKEQ
jgi:lipopolysaccharide biosynthesis glycosyltransferase